MSMKNVALFHDLSGYGKCSLTAAISVLSVLGISCHPIPTAVYTGQGGYPVFFFRDMTEMMPEFIQAWKQNEVTLDGIYSGYLMDATQIRYVLDCMDTFCTKESLIMVDPVMGDHGKGYRIYNQELLNQMKQLIKKANIITPNVTEACFLSGRNYDELMVIEDETILLEHVILMAKEIRSTASKQLKVVITGLRLSGKNEKKICNIVVDGNETHVFRYPLYDKSFSGTGDIFASVVYGLYLNGHSLKKAVQVAGEFIQKSIADTITYSARNIANSEPDGNDGVMYESHLKELILFENVNNEE